MADWKDRVEIKLYKDQESKLQAEADRLVATGEMPSLDEVRAAIEETRKKYLPLIVASRRKHILA